MIKKVLLLGSGALKIGQAGEFDYSGSQALKALREENVKSVLINPNIATVQTSEGLADEVYFLPVTPYFVTEVIKKERPDGIMLSFGGQTALNCGVALNESGVLSTYGVRILGSPIQTIQLTEDRKFFADHLRSIGKPVPSSFTAKNVSDAKQAAAKIGYPLMIRAGYALGGQGSGVIFDEKELIEKAKTAFSFAPHILVEQYLHHFKEIEYEVVRDRYGNCITVCNMENMDPLGIHTGESIVVAPSQTLNNYEYHALRKASIDIINSLGIVGECNIQFALNPNKQSSSDRVRGSIQYSIDSRSSQRRAGGSGMTKRLDYYVIEVNARLSRSSALASKATGYPLAYVAAKLALGKGLFEIPNSVTKVTQSFFEPALDYCAVKIPRWDTQKFKGAKEQLDSSMQSVGEVMGLGRTFEEALQKAVRMLEIGFDGVTSWHCFNKNNKEFSIQTIINNHIKNPTPKRLFALAYCLSKGVSIKDLHDLSGISEWFLERIYTIVSEYSSLLLRGRSRKKINKDQLLKLKKLGFSDKTIGRATGLSEQSVRKYRIAYGIVPSIFQIDTLSGEFPAKTNYLYCTYHGIHNDVKPFGRSGVAVLGSGPYRIGSSVEFDWSCVFAAKRVRQYDKKSIIINSNPETVSTDYDISDRLYFEEITGERVLDILDFEKPHGIILSVGGQTPNNLSKKLSASAIPILGTNAYDIYRAESRTVFSKALDKLCVPQPAWAKVRSLHDAITFAKKVGYPVLIRPSYVLSGASMNVCSDSDELSDFLNEAIHINPEHPVIISQFIEDAREIECDAVSQNGKVKVLAISDHAEFAGVHSGDATIVYPAHRIYVSTQQEIIRITKALAKEFHITGPFNIQFLVKEYSVYIIEMNLRASRTLPFISKATGINFASKAVDAFFNQAEGEPMIYPPYSVIKASQFSYDRIKQADPVRTIEMTSTGEVGIFCSDVREGFLKAMIAVGTTIPKKKILLSIGNAYKEDFASRIYTLHEMGFELLATEGTGLFIKQNLGLPCKIVRKGYEGGVRTVPDTIRNKQVDFIINIRDKKTAGMAGSLYRKVRRDGYFIRRAAADSNIPLLTDINQAKLFVSSLQKTEGKQVEIQPVSFYHKKLRKHLKT